MKRSSHLVTIEYLKNLFPMIFSVLGGTINTLLDSIFVAKFVGTKALSVVNLSLPIYLVMCTVGALVGCGASVLSSQLAGKEKLKEAEKYYNTALKVIVITGGFFTTLGCIFCAPISGFLAMGSNLYEALYIYAFYTFVAAIPNCLVYVAIQYLQIEGKRKEISYFMSIMVGTDIFLDYLLMVVLEMGIRGAALASLVSVTLACIYGFVMLQTGFSNYHFRWIKLEGKRIKEICENGSPYAAGNFYDVIKTLVFNAVILRIWGENAIAILAILNSVSEISMSLTSGVPSAAGPLLSVFRSTRENESIVSLIKLQAKIGIMLSAAFGILVTAGNGFVSELFGTTVSLLLPLLCISVYIPFDMICSIYSNYISKCNLPLFANLIVLFRRIISPLICLLIVFFSGSYLWLVFPLMGLLSIVLCLVKAKLIEYKLKDDERPLRGILLLDDYLTRQNKVIDFSVAATSEKICEASEQISEFCGMNDMPTKSTIKIQMAIEEILTVYAAKDEGIEEIDLRAFALPGNLGIRIRVSGKRYNPFDGDVEDDDFLMGVNMINKLADVVTYTYTLGLNNLSIFFDSAPNQKG